MQRQGGPCAVIAPVQAYLLKSFLLETPSNQSYVNVNGFIHSSLFSEFIQFFLQLTADKCKNLLIKSLCSILVKCKHNTLRIVILRQIDVCKEAQEERRPSTSMEISAESKTEAVDTQDIPKIDVGTLPEIDDADMNVRLLFFKIAPFK